ncbi:hypothetical protein [Flexivirga sp.]|uniref:hypothetical protein n=1 Tax=Flexivirga sp. TaxID=1962927 RepID=UPI003F814D83
MDDYASGQNQNRSDRWLVPHPYLPTRRNTEFAIDPWHYTDRQGLEGILSSNVLWATENGGLNDPSEVVRAGQSLLETWERSVAHLKPEAPGEEADRWLRGITAEVARRRFFFVSTCYDGNKLQHWKSYARGRGYALEFDRNREFRVLEPPSGRALYWPGFAPAPWWRPVTYGDYENGRTSRGGNLLFGREGIMEHALNEFAARERDERPDEIAFWEHLEQAYLASVCFNKHEAYAEEEEARLVFVEPPFPGFVYERAGGFNSSGRTAYMKIAVAGDGDLDSYSVQSAVPLPVRTVRVGPRYGSEVDREIREITGLLRDHGYLDVKVTASAIPFRG